MESGKVLMMTSHSHFVATIPGFLIYAGIQANREHRGRKIEFREPSEPHAFLPAQPCIVVFCEPDAFLSPELDAFLLAQPCIVIFCEHDFVIIRAWWSMHEKLFHPVAQEPHDVVADCVDSWQGLDLRIDDPAPEHKKEAKKFQCSWRCASLKSSKKKGRKGRMCG